MTGKILNVPKIKELMKKDQYSQKELATDIGVSPGTLSDWFNGKYQPNKKHLNSLAEVLNTDEDSLLMEQPNINIGANSVVYQISNYYYVNENATLNINNYHPKFGEDESQEINEPNIDDD